MQIDALWRQSLESLKTSHLQQTIIISLRVPFRQVRDSSDKLMFGGLRFYRVLAVRSRHIRFWSTSGEPAARWSHKKGGTIWQRLVLSCPCHMRAAPVPHPTPPKPQVTGAICTPFADLSENELDSLAARFSWILRTGRGTVPLGSRSMDFGSAACQVINREFRPNGGLAACGQYCANRLRTYVSSGL
jgi:hypothetical protein